MMMTFTYFKHNNCTSSCCHVTCRDHNFIGSGYVIIGTLYFTNNVTQTSGPLKECAKLSPPGFAVDENCSSFKKKMQIFEIRKCC